MLVFIMMVWLLPRVDVSGGLHSLLYLCLCFVPGELSGKAEGLQLLRHTCYLQ